MTALHMNARQLCEHRTAAMRLVKINLRYAICLQSAAPPDACGKSHGQTNSTFDVKQALTSKQISPEDHLLFFFVCFLCVFF